MRVQFHDLTEENPLKYVVIQARYQNQWVFVRHKKRATWEIPGGHIEEGEKPDIAALRELKEETGASEVIRLIPICDYSVTRGDEQAKSFGRLYYAQIAVMESLGQYEIGERLLCDRLPELLTYPQIQNHLFDKVCQSI